MECRTRPSAQARGQSLLAARPRGVLLFVSMAIIRFMLDALNSPATLVPGLSNADPDGSEAANLQTTQDADRSDDMATSYPKNTTRRSCILTASRHGARDLLYAALRNTKGIRCPSRLPARAHFGELAGCFAHMGFITFVHFSKGDFGVAGPDVAVQARIKSEANGLWF
jgi:hypothetical protein